MGVRQPVLRLDLTVGSDSAVITAHGVVDLETAGRLEAAVSAALDDHRAVVLDLHEVSMCDSSGLGILVRLRRRALAAGRIFELRSPQAPVATVLDLTGISRVVPVQAPRDG